LPAREEKASVKRSSSFLPGTGYIGIIIPGVSLEGKVAEGGCAEVFRGTDEMSGCPVAVKVLSPRNRRIRKEFRRLLHEGEIMSKIKYHDCIVQSFRYGVVENVPYLVEEWIDGVLLRDRIRQKKVLSDKEIVMLAAAMGRAMRHLHGLGILHKDIKPDNIFCCEDGGFKLIDFGIAEMMSGWKLPFFRHLEGSPAYMAPELIRTKRATVQSDIYALCCTLYECATGHPPFVGSSYDDVLKQQVDPYKSPRAPRDSNKNISVYTNRMIALGLAKDPARRYKTADELLLEIGRNPQYEINLSDKAIRAVSSTGVAEDAANRNNGRANA
jgi:serine/threonine-protein kinase